MSYLTNHPQEQGQDPDPDHRPEEEQAERKWFYTRAQSEVLDLFSREDRDYALEHGPVLLARKLLGLDLRLDRYSLDGKSTSELLYDVARRRLDRDSARTAHIALFGTVSEHSTAESEAFLAARRSVLALLPAIMQERVSYDGTLTEIARNSLGPYACAEWERQCDTRAELEHALLVKLVKRYSRDEDLASALRLMDEHQDPPSALGNYWPQDSLEFDQNGGFRTEHDVQEAARKIVDSGNLPLVKAQQSADNPALDWQAYVFPESENPREPSQASPAPEEKMHITPTREQSMGLGGLKVTTDLPEPTPPNGPVIDSPFADIVKEIGTLSYNDRVHLFAELWGLIPVKSVVQVLEDPEGPRAAIVANLSHTGRIQLAYRLWAELEPAQREVFLADPDVRATLPQLLLEALRHLDDGVRDRVLGGVTQALTDVERKALATTLLRSLPMSLRDDAVFALGDKLPPSLREALGLRSVLFQAGISLTFPSSDQTDDEQD